MRALLLSALLALPPAAGLAGAWARGEGKAFLSFKATADPSSQEHPDPTFALYGEYGLAPRLTLGASYDKLPRTRSLARAFGRWNVTAPDAAWQVALEGGAGVEFDDTGLGFGRFAVWRPAPPEPPRRYYNPRTGEYVTLAERAAVPTGFAPAAGADAAPPVRPAARTFVAALHAGRGFATPAGNGWLDMRLGAEISLDDRPTLVKLDLVAGLSLTERGFVSLEMRGARSDGYAGLAAVPTLGYELRPGLQATIGAILDARGDAPARIELGTWVSF